MSEVVSLSSRHYAQCHAEARVRCRSLQSFLEGFDVAVGHVHQRAASEAGEFQMVRRSIGPRDIAAVILQGQLNYGRCETGQGFKKIAIEALFKELGVVDMDGAPVMLTDVQVRVVLKELVSGGRMIVVSYYKLRSENETDGFPEVDYEQVWV